MRALIAAAAALLLAGPALAGPVTLKANPVDADGQVTLGDMFDGAGSASGVVVGVRSGPSAVFEARPAGEGLQLAGLDQGRGARAGADHHAGGGPGAVEQVAQRDLPVHIHRIGPQRDRTGEGGPGDQQGRGGGDQSPHDFTCPATDSIWSAVVMTLEFIS